MMETADPRAAGDLRNSGGPVLDGSSVWSIFLERIVSPVLMVISHVLANETPQMAFIQRNDVVQKLSTTASDPSLCEAILPRGLNTGPLRLQTHALQESDHRGIELRVAIQNDVTIWSSFRKCLT